MKQFFIDMWYSLKYNLDDIFIIFKFALVIVILIIIMGVGVNYLCEKECSSKSSMMNLNHKYGFVMGCLVEVEPNKWYPIESVHYIERKTK